MEEDKLHGGSGIDLESERERLNYRPRAYEREVERRGNVDTTSVSTTTTDEEDGSGWGVTYIIEQVLTYEQLLKESKRKILDIIGNRSVSVPRRLSGLASAYGISETMTASDYERLFNMSGDGGAEAFTQAWESYAEDVDGDLAMEYLEDVLEMEQNLDQSYRLLDESVFPYFGIERTGDDAFLEKLKGAEKERQRSMESLMAEKEKSKEKMRRHVIDHDVLEQAVLKDSSRALRRRAGKMLEEESLIRDTMEMVSAKLGQEYRTLVRLNTNLEDTRISSQSYVDSFLPMVESENELQGLVQKGKGVLKLSVDKQIDDKHKVKAMTRNHLSLDKRERVQRAYLDESEIAKEWVSDWRFVMLEQETSDDAVDEFFDAMAIGMAEAERRRRQRAEDLYQMQVQEAKLRREKIDVVSGKETAREGYRQMKRHLENM